MVEAGADQVPEDTILEALELAHAEIRKIGGARGPPRAGKAKWVDVDLTTELEAAHGDAVRTAIAGHGLKEAGRRRAARRELSAHLDVFHEDDMTKRAQVARASPRSSRRRACAAVEALREQFLSTSVS